jgi:hypothetical protein
MLSDDASCRTETTKTHSASFLESDSAVTVEINDMDFVEESLDREFTH